MKGGVSLNTHHTAWSEIQKFISESKNAIEVLPGKKEAGEKLFGEMRVTSRSLMGTLVLETGGLLIDHGWLCFLGSGSPKLQKNILQWNSPKDDLGIDKAFIVAYDVVGGFFAVNGGAFPGEKNHIFYWQPDVLQWLNMKGSYSQLFSWALTANLDHFYGRLRWPGWQEEVKQLTGDQGFSIHPFLWAKTDVPLAERSRRAVPMTELWYLGQDIAQHLQNVPPGTDIQIHFTEPEEH
jgi:Protein of unknown function DUF2625